MLKAARPLSGGGEVWSGHETRPEGERVRGGERGGTGEVRGEEPGR